RDRPTGDRLQPLDDLRPAVRQIVEADDFVSGRDERDRDVTADISGTAGQKSFQIRTFTLSEAGSRLAALPRRAKRAISESGVFPAFAPVCGGACPAAAQFPRC